MGPCESGQKVRPNFQPCEPIHVGSSRHHLTATFLKLFGAKSPLAKLRYLNGVIMQDYSQICNQCD